MGFFGDFDFIHNSVVDNRWVLIHISTLYGERYWNGNMNDMRVQPLCADCLISEAGPSVGEPSPPDGHIRHTLISLSVLYKRPPAPLENQWYAPHHLQHVPTQNIVWTVMLGGLMTNMDNIMEGRFFPGSYSYKRASTITTNLHVTESVEYRSKVFLCQLPSSSNEIYTVILS
jgi:hypothetical protein